MYTYMPVIFIWIFNYQFHDLTWDHTAKAGSRQSRLNLGKSGKWARSSNVSSLFFTQWVTVQGRHPKLPNEQIISIANRLSEYVLLKLCMCFWMQMLTTLMFRLEYHITGEVLRIKLASSSSSSKQATGSLLGFESSQILCCFYY